VRGLSAAALTPGSFEGFNSTIIPAPPLQLDIYPGYSSHKLRQAIVFDGLQSYFCVDIAGVFWMGQATVPLEPLVADGRQRRKSDSWVSLSGRHCDGLQVFK
jgi:hypothetical protein